MNPVIGGISITGVQVYDQRPSPDGNLGGCPHLHAVAHEVYMIRSGNGWVEFHEPERGMWTEELRPGDVLQFPPGILHRIVTKEHLEIIALLSHAGLAEAGDARIWFGPETDADEATYRAAAQLPDNPSVEDALDRRDRSVAAYQQLVAWWQEDKPRYRQELTAFRNRHGRAMAARDDLKERLLQAHPAWGEEGLQRLAGLPQITPDYAPRRWALYGDEPPRLGMCGLLRCVL